MLWHPGLNGPDFPNDEVMIWEVKPYDQLSLNKFHDLLELRINIFVVEQDCPYPELDGKDALADHVLGTKDGKVVATARILPAGVSYEWVSIGRVALAESERGNGTGHQLMEVCMKHIKEKKGEVPVKISAQEYLKSFYEKHGFEQTSAMYLEDGIPHIAMKYNP